MIFVFDGIYDLEVTYDYDDDTDEAVPIFTFINDNGYEIIIVYWSIERGSHQRWIENHKNGQKHGTQYCWWSIRSGGRLHYIANYQNGQLHGNQYAWYNIQGGGHLWYIENHKNGKLHGTQHYWRSDKTYYTESY
jgi:antitoxin component YwqK of YwqJK toxin-antitoxin module